jgi:hypothetical protein
VKEDRDHKAWVAVMVQKLEDGTLLDLAPGENVDLTQAAGWPESRRIPGEALRAALLEPNVNADPRGLRIRAAYITGINDLANLRLSFGLHFDSCAFQRSANWSGLAVASLKLIKCTTPALTLMDAQIGGALMLQGTTLIHEGREALSLDRAGIKGSAFLNPVTVTGQVRAPGATIGGQLNLRDATLTHKGGRALLLDDADIKGGVYLNRATVTGEVKALGVTTASQLNLQGATLKNAGGNAVSLDGANIKDAAFLNSVTVTGQVRAVGATIGGQLNLRDATLTHKGGHALVLHNADIKGGGIFNSVTVVGEVGAQGATIVGQLNLRGATLKNDGGIALGLESARVDEVVLAPAEVKGTISLGGAQITVLKTPADKNDMKVLIDNELSASGWRLGDVRGRIRHDRKAASDWLSRDSAEEFVAQPWHELANVYERNGQPADARWMRWKAAQGVTRTSPRWSKPIRRTYGALVGHGYYPLIAAVWLILAIAASGIIVAAKQGVFTPSATSKAAWKTPPPASQPPPPITGATPCGELQERSSCLNPVLYAFDNALPGTLATGQAAQWTANGAQGWNAWIPYTLGGLKIASWILVALLLAGVTGLLRKT